MPDFSLSKSERSAVAGVVEEHNFGFYLSCHFLDKDSRDKLFVIFAWIIQARLILENIQDDRETTLQNFRNEFLDVWKDDETKHLVTLLFVRLAKHYKFQREWCLAFLDTLALDLKNKRYTSQKELDEYFHNSAEMIALMIATTLQFPVRALSETESFAHWLSEVENLRSTGKNWRAYGRVSLPAALLEKSDLSPELLWERRHSWQWHRFVQAESKLLKESAHSFSIFSVLPVRSKVVAHIWFDCYWWLLGRLSRHPILCWNIPQVRVPFWLIIGSGLKWWWLLIAEPAMRNTHHKARRVSQRLRIARRPKNIGIS